MTLPMQRLGDHVEPVATWCPASGSSEHFSYIDLSAVDQEQKAVVGARTVAKGEAPSRARQLVRARDVLVSTVRPNLNGVAIVPAALDGATASTGFCVLRPREATLDPNYLFQWVKSQRFVDAMVREAIGASYPAVSDSIVLRSRLPLPKLTEQRRIAVILDQAEALRAQRRAAIELLDELVKAIFVEMFGDPAQNSLDLPTVALGELGEWRSGGTPPRTEERFFDGDIPWFSSGELGSLYVCDKRGVRQKNLNLSMVREIQIPLPSIELQDAFAGRLLAIEQLRMACGASLTHLDALFASLQHRAFRGEL